jgi:hypothetical protein
MEWFQAYMAHKPVTITTVGIGYMIAPGGGEGSNTDPYADGDDARQSLGPSSAARDDRRTRHENARHPSHRSEQRRPVRDVEGTPYAHIMAR